MQALRYDRLPYSFKNKLSLKKDIHTVWSWVEQWCYEIPLNNKSMSFPPHCLARDWNALNLYYKNVPKLSVDRSPSWDGVTRPSLAILETLTSCFNIFDFWFLEFPEGSGKFSHKSWKSRKIMKLHKNHENSWKSFLFWFLIFPKL